ncbi:hypothetical protein PEC301619_12920 [Pectobacterium carotovorum subsp. carotovorum]|nr:hypothetical protein PEC301619_12920 [Pectobacterium carotovorum subsp. carotovorum]
MENAVGNWSVDLNTECPECGDYIDMNKDDSFTNGEKGYALQRLENIPVTCPECGHEFKVDTYW